MSPLTQSSVRSGIGEPDDTHRIPVGDGAALSTDIYLPASRSARTSFPTLVVRTPYGKRGSTDRVSGLAAYFRDLGIAVVVQDIRGKFDSSGERVPFRHELSDGYQTVDWIAQQRWSDGSVIPYGDSYAGFTAWAAAASGHRSIRGAVVRVTTPDIGSHWMYRGGVFRMQMNAQWAAFAWGAKEIIDVQPDWQRRPLKRIDFGGADMSALATWLSAGSESRAWRALVGETATRWASLAVPVLHWGGWWDMMARGQIGAWQRLVAGGARGQRLLMGATDHGFNHFPPGGMTGDASVSAHYQEIGNFLTSILRGDQRLASSVRWELAHEDWRELDRWPPTTAETTRLFLVDAASAAFGPEGGGLRSRPETLASTVIWRHDPANLVPSLEPSVWSPLSEGYPDERDAQVRDDVVTFSASPASEPLDIAGGLALHLQLQTSQDAAQIVATLSDVQPDGTAWRIAEGAALMPKDGGEDGLVIDLGPLAYRLAPGHRLRLALSASCFPRYMWPCADVVDGWNGASGDAYDVSLKVGVGSYLEVPLCR